MRFHLKLANSVYARIFFVLCIVAVPTVIGLGVYAYYERNQNLADSQNAAQQYVDMVAQHESWLLKGYEQTLSAIAVTPVIEDRDWSGCQRYFPRILESQKRYINVGIIDLTGQVQCAGTGLKSFAGKNLADRSYFQRVLAQSGFVLSNYLNGRISKRPTMLIAMALKGADGKPDAVLYAAFDLNQFEVAQDLSSLRSGAHLIVADRNGTILFSTREDGSTGKKASWHGTAEHPAEARHTHTFRQADGTLWFAATAGAGTVGDPRALSVRYEYPAEPLLSVINRGFWIDLAAILCLFMIVLTIGWIAAQAIIGRNIRLLIGATKQLRRHNFSTRIAHQVSGHEFTEIASHFDDMSEELKFREEQWKAVIQRQTKQNAILQQAIADQPLDQTLTALAEFAQEQTTGTSTAITLADRSATRIEKCIGPSLPPAYAKALVGLKIGPLALADGTAMHDRRNVICSNIRTDPKWASLGQLALDNHFQSCWAVPIISPDGQVLGALSFYRETQHVPSSDEMQLGQMAAWLAAVVIDRHRTAGALAQSEAEYRLLFETNPHPMWVYDCATSRILAVNNQAISHYGYSRREFLEMNIENLIIQAPHSAYDSTSEPEPRTPNLTVQTHRKKDQQIIVVEISFFPLHFQGRDAQLALINDVTKYREYSEALQYRVKYDIITGLLNRASFLDQLNTAIDLAQKANSAFYVIILSLSEFKEINISMGYAVGDQLLKETSERLRLAIGPRTVAARLSGDEFAILIEPHAVRFRLRLIEDLAAKMKQPFTVNGTQIQVGAHIGAARYPSDGASTSLLLQHANSALLKAKKEGFGHVFYDAADDYVASERVLLATQLLRGLNEQEFELYYQPKVPLQGCGKFGFEALTRWNSPDRGLLSPIDFMSVIENGDLIHPFTLWVLNSAIEQCMKWHEMGYEVTIAVNISARNLLDLLLPERVRQVLSHHGCSPKYLELEITESSIMPNPGRSLGVLRKIRDMGVEVAIDDFGTGYSSLSYLQKLPVSSLKIDRSFIVEMDHEDDTRPIINSIIEMAHSLNIAVTAEGIESRQTMAKLAGMKCDYAQGYYISRPMPASNAAAWLAGNVPKTLRTAQNTRKPQ